MTLKLGMIVRHWPRPAASDSATQKKKSFGFFSHPRAYHGVVAKAVVVDTFAEVRESDVMNLADEMDHVEEMDKKLLWLKISRENLEHLTWQTSKFYLGSVLIPPFFVAIGWEFICQEGTRKITQLDGSEGGLNNPC